MPIDLEFHFQNYKYFPKCFGLYIGKNNTRNFCLFVYLRSYNDKSKFSFLETEQSSAVIFENEPFLRKMLVSIFSSNIPLYIGKIPVEKLCKVLEMELKTYTPVVLKFDFEKIKVKVLQFNMILFLKAQGLVKIRSACSKALLLTILSSKCSPDTKHELNYLQRRVETQYRSYLSHQVISNIL